MVRLAPTLEWLQLQVNNQKNSALAVNTWTKYSHRYEDFQHVFCLVQIKTAALNSLEHFHVCLISELSVLLVICYQFRIITTGAKQLI